jgi:hypothetical protein
LGCGAEAPESPVLPVRLHTLPSCDVGAGAASANLTLLALGDFEASNESAEILPLDRTGAALRFPSATQALEARVDQSPGFWGYGERTSQGLDVLLWPKQATCVVFRPDGSQGYPGKRGGQALGYAAGSRTVLAAGGNDALVSDAIVGALTFDVATGALSTFDTSEPGVLRKPRAFATATSYGGKLLVAGGENPLFGVAEPDIEPRDSAEVFDSALQRFVGEIELLLPRTRHAAVTLADGRTLLVGGRTKSGNASLGARQLELLDPRSDRAEIGQQIEERIDPRALLLSDGRVFIGGGTTFTGQPAAPAGAWLTPDAKPDATLDAAELPLRYGRAFAPLLGGGVLAVGGCEERDPDSDDDAARCAALCERGCPPRDNVYDARWIAADGSVSRVELDGISAPRPVLLPGSDGSPWLVASAASDPLAPVLYRFNPWDSSFSAVSAPGELQLPRAEFPQPVVVAPDTFVWLDELDEHGQLLGLKLGTRNRFAQDVALVLQTDEQVRTRPLHLVPERPLREPERYDGRLWLNQDATPPTVVRLADTDYADVTLQIHLLDAGDTPSVPPVVLLGDVRLGGETCAWPDGETRGGDADIPTLARSGEHAELRYHGARQLCTAPKTRVSLGITAGSGESVIARIDVRREAAARH